jgi:hypothetical protein
MTNAKPTWSWNRLANLRARVQRSLDVCETAARLARTPDPDGGPALASAISELVAIMQVELTVEAGELLPLMAATDGDGPARAAALAAELAAERDALMALAQDPAAPKPLAEIADAVLDVIARLRWSLRRENEILAPSWQAHSFEEKR